MAKIRTFDDDGIRRIGQVVRQVENTPRNKPPEVHSRFRNRYSDFRIGILDEELAYASSARVSIWSGTGGSETDSDRNIEEVFSWLIAEDETIAAGTEGFVVRCGAVYYFIPGCEVSPRYSALAGAVAGQAAQSGMGFDQPVADEGQYVNDYARDFGGEVPLAI